MRIGEHEVEVISKDEVKVGCQRVKRAEIEAVLKEMDKPPQMTIEKMPHLKMAVVTEGPCKGHLLLKTYGDQVRSAVVYLGGGGYSSGWDWLESMADLKPSTPVRLLESGESFIVP